MFYLIRSDVNKGMCLVFDDETLDYTWESNNTITDYIRLYGDVGNCSFCDSIRSSSIEYSYADDLDSGKAVTNYKKAFCSFSNHFERTYKTGVHTSTKHNKCMFKLEGKNLLFVVLGDYLFKIDIIADLVINDKFQYTLENTLLFLHGIGVDEHGRFRIDLKVTNRIKRYYSYVMSIYLYTDGTFSCRKLKVSRVPVGVKGDFKTLKRRLLLRG